MIGKQVRWVRSDIGQTGQTGKTGETGETSENSEQVLLTDGQSQGGKDRHTP